jgi:hypothetical protein
VLIAGNHDGAMEAMGAEKIRAGKQTNRHWLIYVICYLDFVGYFCLLFFSTNQSFMIIWNLETDCFKMELFF